MDKLWAKTILDLDTYQTGTYGVVFSDSNPLLPFGCSLFEQGGQVMVHEMDGGWKLSPKETATYLTLAAKAMNAGEGTIIVVGAEHCWKKLDNTLKLFLRAAKKYQIRIVVSIPALPGGRAPSMWSGLDQIGTLRQ